MKINPFYISHTKKGIYQQFDMGCVFTKIMVQLSRRLVGTLIIRMNLWIIKDEIFVGIDYED